MQTKLVSRAVVALAMWAVPAAHAAQPAYPEKPIRLIIGSAPGSGPDIIARLAAGGRLFVRRVGPAGRG